MSWVALAAVVLVAAVLLATILRRQAGRSSDAYPYGKADALLSPAERPSLGVLEEACGSDAYPYRKADALFSPAERSFLGVLEEACGADFKVFGKVRVADVVSPLPGMDAGRRQSAFNKTSGKHFDFLVCSASDLSVACAIELNDSSHHLTDRQSRDAFLQGVCNAASLPLLKFAAKHSYSVQAVRASVHAALTDKTVPAVAPSSDLESDAPHLATSPSEPFCPECAIPMVRRRGRRGTVAGKTFWGCTNYPKCRATIPINA